MFRLEKVFQNDDSVFIYYVTFLKTLFLFILIYCFAILQKNTVYDLISFEIFKKSNFYNYTIIVTIFYLIFSLSIKNKRYFRRNFISFIREDIFSLVISNFFAFSFFFLFKKEFIIDVDYLNLNLVIFLGMLGLHIYFNFLYQNLINKNIIQKNVMLVGNYSEIKQVLNDQFNKIYIFKCCIISDIKNFDKQFLKSEFRIPIFNENEDIRSILEYHSLGQIWILNGHKKDKKNILEIIIKYSVDTLNINLEKIFDLKGEELLANKYKYEFYEWSRFFGINLFFKILIDKFFSILFLIISSPLIILSCLLIYLEDGLPIFFTQNRTGWDGRRFKIFKIRTLKKMQFDKTKQVLKDDKRLLKIGKLLRRYSIDELPQFYNVLNGDMSIVGPRPHMVEHDIHYSSLFKNFLKRHKCNPGLTGWAQVNGLRGATPKPEVMKRRMEFDLWYLNNWTIWLDIYIIFKTFYAVFKYKGD